MNNVKHKKLSVAYVTGTRADFGLMSSVLFAIEAEDDLELTVYATGMHLMKKYGQTIKEVEEKIKKVIKVPAVFGEDGGDKAVKFLSDFIPKFVRAIQNKRPDVVMVLGDRVEMLGVAVVCNCLRIPLCHVHGGDKSGTIDEVVRHTITKLSQVHFVASQEAEERVKKMGEEPGCVHRVGAPALDTILNYNLPNREELFRKLKIDVQEKIILLTVHPSEEQGMTIGEQMRQLIKAVKKINLPVVVIYPNTDQGSEEIIAELEKERDNKMFRIFPHIEYKMFLALERECSVWVGNSSGAIIESASFGTPVVNVGSRQFGRLRGKNIFDVGNTEEEIVVAIRKSLEDNKYLASLKKIKNPWGDGQASVRIVKVLKDLVVDGKLINKQITY